MYVGNLLHVDVKSGAYFTHLRLFASSALSWEL